MLSDRSIQSFYVNGEGCLPPDSKDNNTETSSGSSRYDISDNSADEHDETSELPADGNIQSTTITSEPRSVARKEDVSVARKTWMRSLSTS
jgi:hypothetical protein